MKIRNSKKKVAAVLVVLFCASMIGLGSSALADDEAIEEKVAIEEVYEEPAPAPEPEPEAEPEPVPAPAPEPVSVPVPAAEPVSAPAPVSESAPVTVVESIPASDPVVEIAPGMTDVVEAVPETDVPTQDVSPVSEQGAGEEQEAEETAPLEESAPPTEVEVETVDFSDDVTGPASDEMAVQTVREFASKDSASGEMVEESEEEDDLRMDVNHDGVVDAQDAVIVLCYLSGSGLAGDWEAADADSNGYISLADAMLILSA